MNVEPYYCYKANLATKFPRESLVRGNGDLTVGKWDVKRKQIVSNLVVELVKHIVLSTYSGAKKYLVSHQLCKFSHLKR